MIENGYFTGNHPGTWGAEMAGAEVAVKLIDEGNTIPFISRYRKEATGTLNDEAASNLNERLTYLLEIWKTRRIRFFPALRTLGKTDQKS